MAMHLTLKLAADMGTWYMLFRYAVRSIQAHAPKPITTSSLIHPQRNFGSATRQADI